MTSEPALQGLDAAHFLRHHWQRHPRLLRGALTPFRDPLTTDELAGLALEPEAESRLIRHHRDDDSYALEHGPFSASQLQSLPAHDWTLLVQAVDQWSPAVATLLEPFRRLLPDWRIDDVMVSVAAEGGGVGPHYDHYDVFLIQGQGRRRWRLGALADEDTAQRSGTALRLLREFSADTEYDLTAGDVLYVPPGWGHWGEALSGPCMTYSIGFRAPDQAQLIAHWADHVLADCSPFRRYTDPPLRPDSDPILLDTRAVDRARALVLERLAEPEAFARWFASWLSEAKYPEWVQPPEPPLKLAELHRALAQGHGLRRNPASRLLLYDGALYADGERYPLRKETLPLAERVCRLPRHGELDCADTALGAQSQPRGGESAQYDLLLALLNRGTLWLTEDEAEAGREPGDDYPGASP